MATKLADDPAWKALKDHFDTAGKSLNMRDMFAEDSERFNKLRWDFWLFLLKKFLPIDASLFNIFSNYYNLIIYALKYYLLSAIQFFTV